MWLHAGTIEDQAVDTSRVLQPLCWPVDPVPLQSCHACLPLDPPCRLEAAEAAMAAARQQHDRINPRFVAALQASGADVDAPALPSGADRDEDGADSDEEWKGIKARAASHTAPQGNTIAGQGQGRAGWFCMRVLEASIDRGSGQGASSVVWRAEGLASGLSGAGSHPLHHTNHHECAAARKPLGSTSAQRHAGGGGEDEGPDDKVWGACSVPSLCPGARHRLKAAVNQDSRGCGKAHLSAT